MNTKTAIVIVFLIAATAIVMLTTRVFRGAPDAALAASGSTRPAPKSVTVRLVHSTESREWLQGTLAGLNEKHPEIQVELIGKGSLEAAQAILDGQLEPTLWSPADSMVLEMLASDYRTKHHRALFFASGDDAPVQLLLSPVVFVVWEDRAQALTNGDGALGFKAIHDAVVAPRGWLAAGGKPEWGFVKLGHTDPTRSNSGLQALLLMTIEHWNKREGISVGDLLDPGYQKFVRETERGVQRFEASTGTFMDDMVRFGPSKYDIAVVYENLAIAQIEHAQGRWGNLRVFYPASTVWSDHPIALLDAPWISKQQAAAARAVVQHLRGRPAQQSAIEYGFRPADPAVPIKTDDARNPWLRLAEYGLRVELAPVAPTPDGSLIRNLLMMWSRVVRP